MKKFFLFITAILLFAGCAKEQFVEERSYSGPVTVVSATFESLGDDATKAAVADAGTFTWQNGDKAAFTAAAGSSYCTGTNSKNDATADFTINGDLTFNANSFAFYPSDLITGQYTSSLKVKVPGTREWKDAQTNVAMYGTKYNDGTNTFRFTHMGGLVRVKINYVPTNARKFVFKTRGYKINGEFDVINESSCKVIKTASSNTESEQKDTLTWTTAPEVENTMYFYIPLPTGNYENGFAFSLLDQNGAELISKTASQSVEIKRKDLILMPAITLAGGFIEPAEKAAVVQEVPAGHDGDFLLANSEKVLLKINSDAAGEQKDINLKYDEGTVPTELEIQVVGENTFTKTLSGNLPYTHVDFTQGKIANVEMTTSDSTFAVIYPATISEKLTVTGGNVVLKGATVNSIVVASGAVADSKTNDPVQIVMEKYRPTDSTEEQTPAVSDKIEASANVVVAPAQDVTVKVEVAEDAENVNIITSGEGTVTDTENKEIKAGAAMIGDKMYPTLAAAIAAVQDNETITMQGDVNKASGISVLSGKNFTVDFQNHKYAVECPGAGSAATKTSAFQLLQGSTIVFKNGTIECTTANKDKTWSSGDASKGIALMIQNYANLTLENMTIDATNIAHNGAAVRYALSNNCGNVNYEGGTSIVTATGDYAFDVCKYMDYAAPTVTWNSTGSVTGIIELSGGNFVVESNLKVTTPIRATGASTMTINENVVVSPVDAGFGTAVKTKYAETSNETQKGVIVVNRGGDLKITGQGTIDAKGKCYAAITLTEKGEGETGEIAKLNVAGSSSTASKFIKLQGGQYYAICGNGTRGNTDITIKYALLDAPNGFCIYQPQTGNLTITSGTFNGYSCVGVKSGNISISGGTFNATGAAKAYKTNGSGIEETGQALIIDNCNYPGGTPVVTITGGTFKSANSTAIGNYYGGNKTAAITGFISGGNYSSVADETWLKSSVVIEQYDAATGLYSYATTAPSITGMGKGNKTYKYKLLKDYTCNTWAVGNNLANNITVTFDLGGHTLTLTPSTTSQGISIGSANNNVTLENGTLEVTTNAIIAIAVKNYDGNKLTLANNLTVKTECGAVLVEGKNNTLNCAATINNTGKCAAIQTNGSTTGAQTQINITGGTITSSEVGIYHPAGTLNISGGAITGTTAVYVKSGTTTISGGTLTGNGVKTDYVHNPNGCNSTGDAFVVENCGYPGGAPQVSITDGSFISNHASAFGSYMNGGYSRITGFVASSIKGTTEAVSEAVASSDDVYKNN